MGVIDSTHYRVTCPACNAKDAPELSSMDLPMAGQLEQARFRQI